MDDVAAPTARPRRLGVGARGHASTNDVELVGHGMQRSVVPAR